MIRRRVENHYLLVTQEALATAAASLAQHLVHPGNPSQLAAALQLSERGFQAVDQRPMLDSAGRPLPFNELSPLTLVEIWKTSAGQAEEAGAYCGFLVSLQTLQRCLALGKNTQSLRDVFAVNKAQHLEIERLERLRPQLGMRNDIPLRYGIPEQHIQLLPAEEQALADYQLMLLLQQLTLEIARHKLVFGVINRDLHFRWTDAQHLILNPWPFAPSTLTLHLAACKIPLRVYDHEEELFAACQEGIPTTIPAVLSPGT